MVIECDFLTRDELFKFDRKLIDQVSIPVGECYPPEIFTNYFGHYGGMVYKFKPRRFLEIGARYGYTAIVVCQAALAAGVAPFEYLGIDDESYPPAKGVTVGSCAWANQNFAKLSLQNMARAVKWNSITQGLPPNCGVFDMIHIDGNHDTGPVLGDIGHCWPVLNEGGFLLFDDYQMPPVKRAIEQWLEGFVDAEEVVAVQFADSERGHCYVRKLGITGGDLKQYSFVSCMSEWIKR